MPRTFWILARSPDATSWRAFAPVIADDLYSAVIEARRMYAIPADWVVGQAGRGTLDTAQRHGSTF